MEKTETRSGATTSRLRQMLLEGAFPPDSRLTETVLAEQLGVSRTPVRDALSTLALEGLLGYEPNRGYEVLSCTLDDVLGAYEVRKTLEALACRIVAKAGLDVQARARMMDANEQIERLLESGTWRADRARRWRELNASFHNAIIDAAANKSLSQAIRNTQRLPIMVAGGGARWFTHEELVLLFDDKAVRRSHGDHCKIFSALRTGDGEKASEIMMAHIDHAAGVLRANWDKPGLMRATQAEKK